uniref:Uncharacterized protein n=2 Tax=Octopus bimaculoides TaxID=37653 RepID=A0A0L8G581_OCTBM
MSLYEQKTIRDDSNIDHQSSLSFQNEYHKIGSLNSRQETAGGCHVRFLSESLCFNLQSEPAKQEMERTGMPKWGVVKKWWRKVFIHQLNNQTLYQDQIQSVTNAANLYCLL